MRKLQQMAALGAALAISSAASAATFDFKGLGSTSNIASSDGTITVTITAPGESVGTASSGVGVKSSCCDLSSIQNNETLRLDFSAATDIGGLYLTGWEAADRLTLNYDGGVVDINDEHNNWSSDDHYAINLTNVTFLTLTGNSFGTVARLAGLEDVSASVSEVPVPAAAWLFGSALIGLGGFARKR